MNFFDTEIQFFFLGGGGGGGRGGGVFLYLPIN